MLVILKRYCLEQYTSETVDLNEYKMNETGEGEMNGSRREFMISK